MRVKLRLWPWATARIGGASRIAILAAVLALTLTGAAFGLGQRFRSPEQAAADALPPPPSVLTTVAEQRVLAEPVILRGTVMPGASVKATAPSGATGPDAVVTGVGITIGDTLVEGEAPVEIRGRPLICLVTPFPFYRDIPGWATGPDVDALQAALRRLGFTPPASGVMDAATQSAWSKLYQRRGYQVPVGDQSILAAARAARDSAHAARVSADTTRASARAARDSARLAYDAALNAGIGAADAKVALDGAQATLDKAEMDLRGSDGVLGKAEVELDRARVSAGPILLRSEVLRITAAQQRVTALPVTIGTVLGDPQAALIELNGGPAFVSLLATANQAGMLTVGLTGEAFDESSGKSARLRVASIAAEAVTEKETGQIGYPVRLDFQASPLNVAGRTVRVEVTTDTSQETKLAVPVTAVFAAADRSTYVTVRDPAGSTRNIRVTIGQSGGGWVEILPTPPDGVVAGTVVVVGGG